MNDQENKVSEPKRRGGVPSRDELYRKVANKALVAIDVIVEIMETGGGRMAATKLGAAKIILNKALPDLRAEEISGKDGQQLTVNLIRDYIAQTRGNVPSPDTSSPGSEPIQGPDMAPESKKDNYITGEDGDRVPQPVH
jgi:hypothetical protein